MTKIFLAASLAVALIVGTSVNANASTISWQAAVPIDDAGAFVDKTGSLLVAINSDTAGDAASINGVFFAGTDVAGWNTGVTGTDGVTISSNALKGNFGSTFVQGGGPPAPITDASINNLISSAIWDPQTVTLTGLTLGNTYIIQIIGNDSRNGRHKNFVTVLSDGVNNVATSLASGTAGLNFLSNSATTDPDPRLPGSAIIGTFTADATTQTFEVAGSNNGGASLNSNGRAQINGFQLRSTAVVVPGLTQLVHPGISHKRSDLDRMKRMVEAGAEPWASSFQALSSHARAQHTYQVNVVNQDPSFVVEYNLSSDGWFINDGTAAYYNALMWYITEDARHAEKAIEIFNTYKGLRRNTSGIPLRSGRIWRIIEAAEIIAHTYDGWDPVEMQEFKDMLVYPGYSATTVPTQAINNGDYTFYWHIYQGDPARHGNQGLFCMRTMMAMGIFLDNEVMYSRALRYLRGQGHRLDDLAYPSGPPINNNEITSCNFFDEFTNNGRRNTIQDYGYNEVISNYIYENGQCQESSRDQVHTIVGVITISNMAEMAWSQGDDLYGHLDNRPLLGLEFSLRYNLSGDFAFPDQPQSWEPTVASGEYLVRSDRSGRWTSRIINPGLVCNQDGSTRGNHNFMPIYEMTLGHYRDRMDLPSDDYKWLQRGHALYDATLGVETEGVVTDHPVWGGLAFRRVSPGDPISGFDGNGLPLFAMNEVPMTIEAENFDHFAGDGEGRSFSDTTPGNTGFTYRFDSDVDVEQTAQGDTYVGGTSDGEFLTYTVHVPETGFYNIRAKTGTQLANSNIRFSFAGVDQTGVVAVPNTGGFGNFSTFTVAEDMLLTRGVQQVKVEILGGAFTLDSFTIDTFNIAGVEVNSGEAQRSSVESINVVFDGEVVLADGAVTVVQRSTQTEAAFETVATSVSTQFSNNQTVATIEFDSHLRNSENVLVDGNYQLTLTANLVTQDGVPMSEDFVFGDVETDQFYSFYGDADGDRDVDNVDFSFFLQTYFKQLGNSSYNPIMDYDADGDVDNVDFSFFLGRYFKQLLFEL